MNLFQRRILNATALLFWMGLIYYFSDQANSNAVTEEIFGTANYFARKLAHMTEYAILCLLFYSCLQDFSGAESENALKQGQFRILLSLSLLLTAVYACTDEWHQSFVPGRSALLSDVLIDSCGALIAALILYLRKKRAS